MQLLRHFYLLARCLAPRPGDFDVALMSALTPLIRSAIMSVIHGNTRLCATTVFRRHSTRTSTLFRCATIVTTLKQARRGVGVSREPAKLGSQDNSPQFGEGQLAGNGG